MNKFVVSAVVFSLLMSAAPILVLAQEGSAGVAIPKFISITAEAKARCDAKCSTSDRPEACKTECVAEVQAAADVKAPRDSASGQATGKSLDACRAACRNNNQGNQAALDACLRECNAGGGPATGSGITAPRDSASGLPTGKRQHKPMMIIKEWNAATPILMKRAEERKDDLQGRRDEMKEQMEERREQMKERLAGFKNKTKAAIAERIADSLNKLNERLTTHFANQIDKLEEIMARVAVGDVDGDGTADITAANAAIAEADAAVSVQASKIYTPEVSTEANLKVDVGAARKELHANLKAVEEKMKEARSAVRQAATHVDAEVNVEAEAEVETSN